MVPKPLKPVGDGGFSMCQIRSADPPGLIVAGSASKVTIRVTGAGAPRPRPATAGPCPWGACAAAELNAHERKTAAAIEAASLFSTSGFYRTGAVEAGSARATTSTARSEERRVGKECGHSGTT